jgi:hypothetical protein
MRVLLASDGSAGADQAADLTLAIRWPPETTVEVVAVIEPMATLVPAMPVTSPGFVSSPELDAQIVEPVCPRQRCPERPAGHRQLGPDRPRPRGDLIRPGR